MMCLVQSPQRSFSLEVCFVDMSENRLEEDFPGVSAQIQRAIIEKRLQETGKILEVVMIGERHEPVDTVLMDEIARRRRDGRNLLSRWACLRIFCHAGGRMVLRDQQLDVASRFL